MSSLSGFNSHTPDQYTQCYVCSNQSKQPYFCDNCHAMHRAEFFCQALANGGIVIQKVGLFNDKLFFLERLDRWNSDSRWKYWSK